MSRLIYGLCVALLFTASLNPAHGAEPRPNVIYFLIDDLGREDCGFMGGSVIRTPHIDKLAAAGSRLESYYVQPLCSPTRAALLTGRYPMRYGLQVGVVKPWAQYGLPLSESTLANDLQASGYVTGIFGKWHLGHFKPEYLPTRRGFTHQYGHYNGALDYFTHEREGGFDWHRDDKINRDEGYSTTLLGEQAAQFVQEYAGKKPFFLYVPFNAVHSPYQPPKKSSDEYPQLKGNRKAYAAMLGEVDSAIGRIVDAVDNANVRDNTIFIFSSDNGGPAPGKITDNGKLRGGKGGLYEGGVRVAAFATWEGHIPSGSVNSEPIHAVDWRPTLQKLCDAAPTSELPLDGLDIWATLSSGEKSPHSTILLNTTPGVGAIRAGDWKLIVNLGEGRRRKNAKTGKRGKQAVQLFNLRDDPYETTNLAEQRPEKVKELNEILTGYAKEAVPPKAEPQPEGFRIPAVWGEAGG